MVKHGNTSLANVQRLSYGSSCGETKNLEDIVYKR